MISSYSKISLLWVLCSSLLLIVSGFGGWQYVCLHKLKPIVGKLQKTYNQEKEKLDNLKTQNKQLLPNLSHVGSTNAKRLKQENDELREKLSSKAQELKDQKTELQKSIRELEQELTSLRPRYQTVLQQKEREQLNAPKSLDGAILELGFHRNHSDDIDFEYFTFQNGIMYRSGNPPNFNDIIVIKRDDTDQYGRNGTDQYGRDVYVDQYNNRWLPCDDSSYIAEKNRIKLILTFTPRHSYRICRSATKTQENGYDEYICSNEAALLTLTSKQGNVYYGTGQGIYCSPEMGTPPWKLSSVRIIINRFLEQNIQKGTVVEENIPVQSIFFQLCEQASTEYNPDLWKKMNDIFINDRSSLTDLQQELFPLARFYLGAFKEEASRYYAKQLRLMLPAIMAGKSINSSNRNGNTALHYAAAMGSKRLCIWLVEHGAIVNARNRDNQTPLDCLGVNRSGLDNWLISKGAVRSHPLSSENAILLENGSTDYAKESISISSSPSNEQEAIKKLILRYLVALGGTDSLGEGNIDTLLSCFAEQVDYFNEGNITRDQIQKDNLAYFSTYPKRKFYMNSMEITNIERENYIVSVNAGCILMDQLGKIINKKMVYLFQINTTGNKPLITRIKSQKID